MPYCLLFLPAHTTGSTTNCNPSSNQVSLRSDRLPNTIQVVNRAEGRTLIFQKETNKDEHSLPQ